MKAQVGRARLRVSYVGGGYDFPNFFEFEEVRILTEALPFQIECEVTATTAEWRYPGGYLSGLGGSAVKYLSWVRAQFPEAPWRDQIEVALKCDELQAAGWQDVIAAAYEGLIEIRLRGKEWNVYPLSGGTLLYQHRRLYEIPLIDVPETRSILPGIRSRKSGCLKAMQGLVEEAKTALRGSDIEGFGKCVSAAWEFKKTWHRSITSETILEMETFAKEVAGAWGYKVCGAGGQGYFLIIGSEKCHAVMSDRYSQALL